MAKKRRAGRSGPFRSAPSSDPMPFRDTVEGTIPNGTTAFTATTNDLLPSLQRRTVVFDHFVVEIMPGIDPTVTEEFNAQAQYAQDVAPVGGGLQKYVADSPYKMLSVLNPTQLGVDVNRLKKWMPAVAYAVECDDTNDRLQVQLDNAPTTGAIKVRVTSYCRIIPQLTI